MSSHEPHGITRAVGASVVGASFKPPHCPNHECSHYATSQGWRWIRHGTFRRTSGEERFQCFRCQRCRRRFSVRTFCSDYWLKRRELFPRIVIWSCEGPGLRQSARALGTSHATVMRHVARGGRLALLFHLGQIRDRRPDEPIAIDGFESFEFSQYFPFHLNLAAGTNSWFIYGFTDSPLRRKGRMTETQKQRRAHLESRLGRPHPRAVETGMTTLLDRVLGSDAPGISVIHSDNHPAYPRAIRKHSASARHLILHRITAGSAPRTTRNPLFSVNLADRLFRHGQANHRRETIAFSKRRQGAIERAALLVVWRNYVKPRRENAPAGTAAMAAGVVAGPLTWHELLRERRFPRRDLLPTPYWGYYWGLIKTAALGARQRQHSCRYAF